MNYPPSLQFYNTHIFSILWSFSIKCLFHGQSYLQQPWNSNASRQFLFHYTYCPQKYFYLTNYVSSQLGKHGCQIVITPGEVSGPLVLSDMQFLALTHSQATGATLKGGSTVEHTGFLTQDRDRVVTGPWPNEKMFKCWGPAYSCRLLVRPKPQLLLLVCAQWPKVGLCFLKFYWSINRPGPDPVLFFVFLPYTFGHLSLDLIIALMIISSLHTLLPCCKNWMK